MTLLEKRLIPWRWALALAALLFAGLPLLFPALETWRHFSFPSEPDWRRLLSFLAHTLLLVGGVLLVCLPLGVVLAALLFRCDLPGRRLWQGLILVGVFIPLPLVLSAWQGLLGSDGWLPMAWWENRPGQPWTSGLLPAIWVHALAGLPWVVLLVGLSLTWVERELEEEGLLRGPPWQVFRQRTLPRARAMIWAAGLFAALQAAAEITVTDMFQVPTLAEEVYLQFTLGDRAALARALVGALPWLFLVGWLAQATARRLATSLPALEESSPPLVFVLGRWRWPAVLLILLAVGFLLLIPLAALVYKLGRLGPHDWSVAEAGHRFALAWQVHGATVAVMLPLALLTGFFTAFMGLICAWWMRGSTALTLLLATLALLLAATPGTIIGVGMMEFLRWVISFEPSGLLEEWVYRRGPWTIVWVEALRFWPYALAVFWAILRLVPREQVEAARLEGRGLCWELRHVILPAAGGPLLIVGLLLTALCIGEVAASNRVETPGWETFARLLFERMHNGVDSEVAGLALVMLTGIAALVATCSFVGWLWGFGRS